MFSYALESHLTKKKNSFDPAADRMHSQEPSMNKRISPRRLSHRLLFVVLAVFTAAATATGAQRTTGAQGATGAPAATVPDTSTGVTNWNPAVTYKAGQVVYCAACSTNGSKYIAITSNVNVDPPGNINVVWQLVPSAGANGATGNTGATGATGATGSTGEPAPSSAPPPPTQRMQF
jgi:hypothetical protein